MTGHTLAWASQPDGSDYTAGYDLLALLWDSRRAEQAIAQLRDAPVTSHAAADIAQAAGFTPLPLHDPGVLRELRKLASGRPRHPILCIRAADGIVIADGHHRLSLAYQLAPFAPVPVKLA